MGEVRSLFKDRDAAAERRAFELSLTPLELLGLAVLAQERETTINGLLLDLVADGLEFSLDDDRRRELAERAPGLLELDDEDDDQGEDEQPRLPCLRLVAGSEAADLPGGES